MPTLGLVNIGAVAPGLPAAPRVDAEAILVENGRIAAVGDTSRTGAGSADVVVDCRGTTVIPGLIDSHCHVVLGDYTPRQKTVDFLDSYVHGGITSVVSAGEGVHAPGRPHEPAASKALAIAAAKCFEHFHPNGMRVNAGSVVLEPGLTDEDFAEMARHGVRHAKYGFGGYAHPRDGEPEVRRAQKHGLCVMSHSGNNARAFRLAGAATLEVGQPADLVVCDAPAASLAPDALTAIARGDIPGISAVVIDGEVRVGRSRNTPLAKRLATITGAVVSGAGH